MLKKLTLQERKDVSFEILKYIDQLCKKNNITYFLAYGTLLGAVRHKGFIPWDDDADVLMYTDDYFKFIKLVEEDNKYQALCIENNNGWDAGFLKVNDPKTCLKEINKSEYEIRGVAVDVFPMCEYRSIWQFKLIHKIRETLLKHRSRGGCLLVI